MEKPDLRKQIDESLARLRTMRDELRLRAHLGGMELQDAALDLEKRLDAAAERATQHAADSALAALHQLDKKFAQLAAKVAAAAPAGEGGDR